MDTVQAHEFDRQIRDIQFSADRTYFITASADKSAKVRHNMNRTEMYLDIDLFLSSSSPPETSP